MWNIIKEFCSRSLKASSPSLKYTFLGYWHYGFPKVNTLTSFLQTTVSPLVALFITSFFLSLCGRQRNQIYQRWKLRFQANWSSSLKMIVILSRGKRRYTIHVQWTLSVYKPFVPVSICIYSIYSIAWKCSSICTCI